MENNLTHEAFSGQLNQKFLVQVEGAEPVEMELIEISDLRVTPRQEAFAIVFEAASQAVLPQQIYSLENLENKAMGQIKLFLVPVGQTETSVLYEAVFNRMVKTT